MNFSDTPISDGTILYRYSMVYAVSHWHISGIKWAITSVTHSHTYPITQSFLRYKVTLIRSDHAVFRFISIRTIHPGLLYFPVTGSQVVGEGQWSPVTMPFDHLTLPYYQWDFTSYSVWQMKYGAELSSPAYQNWRYCATAPTTVIPFWSKVA